MSWENSTTEDMLWAARKLALVTADGMEAVMDVLDPVGCRRVGLDRDGEPLPSDGETMTTLEFIYDWHGKLRRLNSMLYELGDRLRDEKRKEADDADHQDDAAAALPA